MESVPLWIVASTHAPARALERYGLRWPIETLFACLKGRGFRFENTRLTDGARIEKTMAVLALTFAWAHYVGDWRDTSQADQSEKTRQAGHELLSLRFGLDTTSEIGR